MKTLLLLSAVCAVLAAPPAGAQTPFTSGSNGSYGPMNISANTELQLPPDGIFHCTTINVAAGATLTFKKNERNTPVYLLATGDVTVAGLISLNATGPSGVFGGKGGPGGWDGGNAAFLGASLGGAGFGPGGEPATGGGPLWQVGTNLMIPIVGGSGNRGGNVSGGSGGSGSMIVASSSRISLAGAVHSLGGEWSGLGAAGQLRFVAPAADGNGTIAVARFRLDALQRTQFKVGLAGSGGYSMGYNMIVFPPNLPKVEIIRVAGQEIDPNTEGVVNRVLPTGSAPQQVVRCRVSNFNGTAKLQVRLTPENGNYINYSLDIPNPGPGPAEGEVTVTFPVNLQTRVDAWTREP